MSGSGKKRHTMLLLALALGMFGFAFALVPLYNVFCEITGLNGKTAAVASARNAAPVVSPDRRVRIGFVARVARGLPWEFRPIDRELVVHPGEMNTTTFYVRNRTQHTVTAQAVPSVAPGQAAQYLKKTQCFCFEQQELPPGGEMRMGVSFYVDAKLPPGINEFTLSYTMFPVSSNAQQALTSRSDR